jgi:hypothetical protein
MIGQVCEVEVVVGFLTSSKLCLNTSFFHRRTQIYAFYM